MHFFIFSSSTGIRQHKLSWQQYKNIQCRYPYLLLKYPLSYHKSPHPQPSITVVQFYCSLASPYPTHPLIHLSPYSCLHVDSGYDTGSEDYGIFHHYQPRMQVCLNTDEVIRNGSLYRYTIILLYYRPVCLSQ